MSDIGREAKMTPFELARSKAQEYYRLWQEAKVSRDTAVEEASAAHSHLGEGYWKEEQRARMMYHAACQLVEALDENI